MAGGCALNSAVWLHKAGSAVHLSGNFIGADDAGKLILDQLESLGLSHDLRSDPSVSTPFCQILVRKGDGERRFILDHKDIQQFNETLIAASVSKTLAGDYSHIFVQPYVRRLSQQFLTKTEKTNAWFMTQDLGPEDSALPYFHCLQLSLSSQISLEKNSIENLARPYFVGKMKTLIFTAGARGVVICERHSSKLETRFFEPSMVTNPVDTTGCGDAFRAGFMHEYARSSSIDRAAETGIQWGALNATFFGSNPIDQPVAPKERNP